MRVTACECSGPGFCSRHNCEKDRFWFEMCRRRPDYFTLWESGVNPAGRTRGAYAMPLPACRHRGIEPIGVVTCDLCGNRTAEVPLYACELFGKCTERRYGTRTKEARETAACMQCAKYEARTA